MIKIRTMIVCLGTVILLMLSGCSEETAHLGRESFNEKELVKLTASITKLCSEFSFDAVSIVIEEDAVDEEAEKEEAVVNGKEVVQKETEIEDLMAESEENTVAEENEKEIAALSKAFSGQENSEQERKEEVLESNTDELAGAEEKKNEVTDEKKIDKDASVPKEESAEEIIAASAKDSRAVADRLVDYLNSYRASSAVKLSGLTAYSEYRSHQLTSNFSHDTMAQREAATALQYGEYVNPSLYGMTGDPYYTAGAREAIAMAGYYGTVDEVAEQLALLIRNSSDHWSYIGSSEYSYIAAGVTYSNGMWYCSVNVAKENTDIR